MVAEERNSTTAYISPEEYLERERNAFEKSEYYQGEIRPMAGATRNHNTIQSNVSGMLYNALRRTSCTFFGTDMRIHIPATTLYTYPDFSLVCGQEQYLDNTFDTLLNPVTLIEVLSKETGKYDQGDKFGLYRSISSLEEYIMIDSRRISVAVWRNENDGWILVQETTNLDDEIVIKSVDAALSIRDVYEQTEGV